ncbi:hypothetical protein HII31_00906 [Pseudocercospora fuligena]|uniref:Uncharacterized protein n=1 Tax=Pseudocercospora fuligena TaxID=685502 RepID=A0A8H6VPI5_9PEZI|nr:hypothetical protein HII31_00906 [Pseudocercospora fuligena]
MPTERVSAVRVACTGEAKNAVKEYEIYSILAIHGIFSNGAVSPLSAMVGCPLVLLKLRPSLLMPKGDPIKVGRKYSSKLEDDFHPNPVASTLMVELPSLCPPEDWKDHVGSVLIARADRKPLHMLHLSVLLGFAKVAADYNRQNGTPFEELLAPANFQAYYPSAIQHLQMDPKCPAPSADVPPLWEEESGMQTMDVESGGVQV